MSKLRKFLDKLFEKTQIYFYAIDSTNKQIVIFIGKERLEFSLLVQDKYYSRTKRFYVRQWNFDKIDLIYKNINWLEEMDKSNYSIELIIKLIHKYEEVIYKLFLNEINSMYLNEFTKVSTQKKILFINDCSNWMEQSIEDSIMNFCYNSDIKIIFLYKFWEEFDYTCYFDSAKKNFKNVEFIKNEKLDDKYIDSLVDENTEIISLNYDYKGTFENISLIVLHKIWRKVLWKYKNIFSFYKSNTIWYSVTNFVNSEKSNVYKFLNPQNKYLFDNIWIVKPLENYVFSWWMNNNRSFNILKSLNQKWILLTDKEYKINNFYRLNVMDNFYAFYFLFKSAHFTIHPIQTTSWTDDRTRMIATSIVAGRPIIMPDVWWVIQSQVEKYKLWLIYRSWDKLDLKAKVDLLSNNPKLLLEYSENCLKYTEENINIYKVTNFIFSKILN